MVQKPGSSPPSELSRSNSPARAMTQPTMKVKGTAFLARKTMLAAKFGDAAWQAFVAKISSVDPVFAEPILATTLLPVEPFGRMHDAMIATFYNNNPRAYWTMGVASAQWALTEGPYKRFLDKGDLEAFVRSFGDFWSTYYTEGDMTAAIDGKQVHVKLRTPFWHVAFEYSTMGYMARALELFTQRSIVPKAISGSGVPTEEIHYVFYL